MEGLAPRRVAIVGLGTMGRQVAWACAVHGLETFLFDVQPGQRESAIKDLETWLADGTLDAGEYRAALRRIRVCSTLAEALCDVALAFENVPEDLEIKRAVHAEIDKLLPEDALQGSNASAITCSPIASATGRMDRFFNMNFSFPRFQGYVELMPNPSTSARTIEIALAWARQIGMIPVVTRKEIMGYTMNRLWRAIKKEALFLADSGYSSPQDIDRLFMLFFGTPFGPFGLMDTVGLDSILKVEERYFDASGDKSDRPAQILLELVEAKRLGEKTGQGFYRWPDPDFRDADWLRAQAKEGSEEKREKQTRARD